MVDLGKGIADDYSSGKPKRDGEDKSRKRKNLNVLQFCEDSAFKVEESDSSDDEVFINDGICGIVSFEGWMDGGVANDSGGGGGWNTGAQTSERSSWASWGEKKPTWGATETGGWGATFVKKDEGTTTGWGKPNTEASGGSSAWGAKVSDEGGSGGGGWGGKSVDKEASFVKKLRSGAQELSNLMEEAATRCSGRVSVEDQLRGALLELQACKERVSAVEVERDNYRNLLEQEREKISSVQKMLG